MKKIVVLLMCFYIMACSKVPAGNVGIKVFLLGGQKGVDVQELTPGRYYIGVNEELFLFPTFTQNYTWTKACVDGDCENEEIGFQTIEGLAVTADVGISYRIDPEKASTIYQKYRKGVEEITDLYLRNMVRDSLVKNASNMQVESVYGSGKTRLIEAVQSDVVFQTKDIGIIVEKVYWIGELRLPDVVTGSINAKIQATQMAEQRRNEVEQSKAEADKKVEEARGEAESTLIRAKAEAESIELRGRALRNNPDLIQLNAIEKWNGILPQVSGSATPFVDIRSVK